MMVAMLPPIILGPIIGPFIDRWNRKRIMVLADASIAVVTVILAVLFWTDAIQVWHVYTALVLRSVGQSFHFPAMQASIPMIVPEKHLTRAAGLNQMLQGVIGIGGPPAGALLMGLLPMQSVLAVDIVTAIIAIGCLLPLFIPQPERAASVIKNTFFSDMMQGFRYIWSWRGLVMLMIISALISFFMLPAYSLLPLMVADFLNGDVIKLGWLESAFGVGIIIGGLALGIWGGTSRKIVTAIIGVIICGLA
jgi:DHA3 family macrolide efflux protein-like MFS transporter